MTTTRDPQQAIFLVDIGLDHVDAALQATTDKRAKHYLEYAVREYVHTTHQFVGSVAGYNQPGTRRWMRGLAPRSSVDLKVKQHYADMATRWYRWAMASTKGE